MSWEEPENVNHLKKSAMVRASITLGKGSPALTVSVGNKVSRALGWHDSVRVRVEYGTGDDAGWIRVTRMLEGQLMRYSNKTVKRGSLVIKVQRVIPGLKGEYTPIRECKHVITPGGDLLVKLPGEFWNTYERKKPYAPKIAAREAERVKANGHADIGDA